MGRYRVAQDPVVQANGILHSGTVAIPAPRAAFDVAK
jgi:hypothetical protein